MNKMIPYEKMSKKRKREENAKKRNSWGNINPHTKVVPDTHKQKRDEERMKDRKEDV